MTDLAVAEAEVRAEWSRDDPTRESRRRHVLRSLGTEWFEQARCRGMDVDLFFPVGTGMAAAQQIEVAKSVCAQCPVRQICLEYAMASGEDDGIWGGLTPLERRTLRLREGRAGR